MLVNMVILANLMILLKLMILVNLVIFDEIGGYGKISKTDFFMILLIQLNLVIKLDDTKLLILMFLPHVQ